MPASNGLADSVFVAEVRRILRDQPVFAPDNIPTDGAKGAPSLPGSAPYRLTRAPVLKSNIVLSATAAATEPGLLSRFVVFDTVAAPTIAPTASDGGPGGALAAASYRLFYTLVASGVESAPSPFSAPVALAAGHRITLGALSGLAANVSDVNVYLGLSTAGGSTVGRLGSIAVVNGATGATAFSGPGDGHLPVLVNSDTGEVIFAQPPGVGTLSASYQFARYSDDQITKALYDGAYLLWPDVWNAQVDTASILVSPTVLEYRLPAIFADQRVTLLEVEFAPPAGVQQFYRTGMWRLIDDVVQPLLSFSKTPPAGAICRLTYAIPPGVSGGLGSVPVEAQNLPVYYALARLLTDQETMRSRADDIQALTGEGASQPGRATDTATYWLNMYRDNANRLSMGAPARRTLINRTVERLNLGRRWQFASAG